MIIPSLHVSINALLAGVLLGGLFAVTALGLSLVFGVMRLINLMHGEILVLGAYVSLELTRTIHIDPLLSVLVVAPVLFLVALPIFRFLLEPVMQRGPEPALLTTFGLSIIGQSAYISIFSGDTQTLPASYSASSLTVLGYQLPVMYLVSFVAGVLLCGGLDQLIRRTGLGREIRASSEDHEASAALGVDVRRTHLLVFGIAAVCAGIGGVLVGTTFDFTPTSGLSYLLSGFVVVVLGGLGSVRGTFIGAILLGVVESLGGAVFGDGYRDFVGFVVFLVVLSFRPQGLFGRRQFA
ncbi:MAG: branched-chain amino acid ABC transporter permease [Frankia sp.]